LLRRWEHALHAFELLTLFSVVGLPSSVEVIVGIRVVGRFGVNGKADLLREVSIYRCGWTSLFCSYEEAGRRVYARFGDFSEAGVYG